MRLSILFVCSFVCNLLVGGVCWGVGAVCFDSCLFVSFCRMLLFFGAGVGLIFVCIFMILVTF